MKKLIVLFSFSLLISSCATILNKKSVMIDVFSVESVQLCLDKDSCVSTPVRLEVPRSYNDFNLLVKTDTAEKALRIKSSLAPEFVWGNLLFYVYSPFALIADAAGKQKIYTYDNSIKIDLSDQKKGYKKWTPSNKGKFMLRASIPYFDFAEFNKGVSLKDYSTYFGLTAGLDYYHSAHSFISLSGGPTGLSDLGIPVMDRVYIENDTLDFVKSYSAKLTNNHDVNIFSSGKMDLTMGYGLNLSHFNYRQVFYDSINSNGLELLKMNKTALGLCFDANLILFKYGYIGMSLLPSFYTVNTKKWEYSQLFYFDFGLRIPLGKDNGEKLKVVSYKPTLLD